MIGWADLRSAFETAWTAAGLDTKFRDLWPAGTDSDDYIVLHDQEASPGQPFPYCVVDVITPRTLERMSGDGSGQKKEIHEFIVMLHVLAGTRVGDSRSARQIAYSLVEEVMKVFGGHPSYPPAQLSLENGGHLLTQCLDDYPTDREMDRVDWTIEYRLLADVPVAIAEE